ncbi:uncharacterized protein [Rutidosis leptorrhynchoides]|uniref:uncharacterized protein n=1 Tax=Rutidosis leptorrhynchoides TaxID=125765 RepID=UPI003A9A1776
MEKHIQIFLTKISYLSIAVSTLILIFIFCFQPPPQTCINPNSNPNQKSHPLSTCHVSPRPITTVDHKNHRLWSTNTWRKSVSSFTSLFINLQTLTNISNHTHSLIMSAGGGQAVMAMHQIGVVDVTGVEVIDSPPLVSRADPHNLPFFDSVFGLGFSVELDQALFPDRYVSEMERTVSVGGVIVVCVQVCGDDEVNDVLKLFRKSEFLGARNVTVMASKMTMIVVKRI